MGDAVLMPISGDRTLLVGCRLLESGGVAGAFNLVKGSRPAAGDRPIDGNGKDTALNRLAIDAYQWMRTNELPLVLSYLTAAAGLIWLMCLIGACYV
jgi:hypothetical protein